MKVIECKDCMYYKKGGMPFDGGRCFGYGSSNGEKLVKATDFCSRAKVGSFEEYERLNKMAWGYVIADLMRG